VSRTILRQAVDERSSVLVCDAKADALVREAKSVLLQNITSAICAPLLGKDGVLGAIYVDRASPISTFTGDDLELLNALAGQVSVAVESALTHDQLSREAVARATYQRFLPAHVVEQIVEAPESLRLGGVTQVITVAFVDVVGFTTLSEKAHPEEVVEMLNRLFSRLTEEIFKHGGTLDKYIGDCVMALFGAPYVGECDAENAVKATVAMMDCLPGLNAEFAEMGFAPVNLSVGLHTGPATVGYIGSERRTDYTAIGDTVNLAARLQSAAAPGQILVSDATAQALGGRIPLKPMGTIFVKGRTEAVSTYEVVR
jgi:adenylate cyclase